MNACDIGIFGLGVMGQNLALNFASRGFSVAVYNRREAGEEHITDTFIATRCRGTHILGAGTPEEFVGSIAVPRTILLMVNAGAPVDDVIALLTPHLDAGDIIIDGGNSHYRDTARRLSQMESKGFLYVGCGISGGAEGALNGPSIMPGGSGPAWDGIRHPLQSIAAKDDDGGPCCEWIGPQGSGHFVKMVHNGIEYASMQLIAEAYDIMRRILRMSVDEIRGEVLQWNDGALHGYLVEVTANVLAMRDQDGAPLVEKILDRAAQKGTGKDLSIVALELGVPATAISESINARFVSAMVDERHRAAHGNPRSGGYAGDIRSVLEGLRDALYCSQLVAYAQGFSIIEKASSEYDWNIDPSLVARIWKNGCIIRSGVLNEVGSILNRGVVENVLLDREIRKRIEEKQRGWRNTVMAAIEHGIPVPALSSAISFFDGLSSEQLPANLIQAQRDYFGAHGYERIDEPRGVVFHSRWDRRSS